MDCLGQDVRKILIVEDVEIAPWRYLADSGWVPVLANVAVLALNKHTAFTHVLNVHFTAHVSQANSLPNMPARLFDNDIPIHV